MNLFPDFSAKNRASLSNDFHLVKIGVASKLSDPSNREKSADAERLKLATKLSSRLFLRGQVAAIIRIAAVALVEKASLYTLSSG